MQDDEPGKEAPSAGPPQKKAAKLSNTSRRNPQRKAAIEAAQALNVRDNLLEQALAPLGDEDPSSGRAGRTWSLSQCVLVPSKSSIYPC